VYGSISEQQRKAVIEILSSTKYLNHLVNELLDQAQLEAGKLILKPILFAPTDLVEETILQLHVLAQGKELTRTRRAAPDMPPLIYGDRARVQQVLMNLLSNAIKFTSTGLIDVYLYQPNPTHWAIQVSDTGIGIPSEAQQYIFDPFRQVDGSPIRQYGGTGLGLSIVKQLTTLMGGQVNLQSKVGQGSIFTVCLPLESLADKVG
jgi:signal transduction histidine kinase